MTQHVSDVMTPAPITVSGQTPIVEAARLMRDDNIGDVVIADQEHVRGLVTDRDLVVRALADGRDPRTTRVQEVCSTHLITCSPEDDVHRAVELMREHAIRRLPVVDDGHLVGTVSIGDLAIELDQASALADISAAPPNR